MRKLDQDIIKNETAEGFRESIPYHQVAVFVMCGGDFLGKFAAEQPADFYIDGRVGKLPYSRKEIMQAVETLVSIAEGNGMDPHRLPPVVHFHACGIF